MQSAFSVAESFARPQHSFPQHLRQAVKRVTAVVYLGLAALAGSPVAWGQAPRAQAINSIITGTVLTQGTNRPVAQALVSVTSGSTGVSRSVLTDSTGQFVVSGVPDGPYLISIEEPGFDTLRTSEEVNGGAPRMLLYLRAARSVLTGRKKDTVSVHELRIPEKAQNEFEKGLHALDKNQLSQSLEHFTKATRLFPGYYEAYYHIGITQSRLGEEQPALEAFQQAINLSDGRYGLAQIGMGYLLYLKGEFKDAEAVLRRGLDVEPNQASGYSILSLVLMRLNRLDEAEKSAQEALRHNPNFAGAYLALSDIYGKKQEYGLQLRAMDSFLQLQPNGPAADRVREMRDITVPMSARNNAPN